MKSIKNLPLLIFVITIFAFTPRLLCDQGRPLSCAKKMFLCSIAVSGGLQVANILFEDTHSLKPAVLGGKIGASLGVATFLGASIYLKNTKYSCRDIAGFLTLFGFCGMAIGTALGLPLSLYRVVKSIID